MVDAKVRLHGRRKGRLCRTYQDPRSSKRVTIVTFSDWSFTCSKVRSYTAKIERQLFRMSTRQMWCGHAAQNVKILLRISLSGYVHAAPMENRSFTGETRPNFCFRPKAIFVHAVQITARRIMPRRVIYPPRGILVATYRHL
jgi:hypothetical protein